jgi:hypothetical protein
MTRHRVSTLLAAGALTLLSTTTQVLADGGCVVVADEAAEFTIENHRQRLEPRAPLRLALCEGLRVETGKITACYLAAGGRRMCVQINKGKGIPENSAVEQTKSIGEAFQATLLAFAKGDAQTKHGQTRGTSKLPGLPYGEIVVLGGTLALPLSQTGVPDIESMSLERADSSGLPSISADLKDGVALFNSKDIAPGTKYRWRLKTARREYSNAFQTASTVEIEKLKPRISEISSSSESSLGRAILLAELYLENGFAFNARAELARNGMISY